MTKTKPTIEVVYGIPDEDLVVALFTHKHYLFEEFIDAINSQIEIEWTGVDRINYNEVYLDYWIEDEGEGNFTVKYRKGYTKEDESSFPVTAIDFEVWE